ncbi:MAG: hypothetical protein ACI857_000941 [Arenicella sp.]|jgi:hypothetical protein
MRKALYLILVPMVMISCGSGKSNVMSGNKKAEVNNGHAVYTGQVVEKEFYNKGGKAMGFSDTYLRLSVQDYFIKFCESKISKKDIEDLKLGEFGSIKVEAEIIDGEWDSCDPEAKVQSRTGNYIIIYAIL